jgi:Nif-specific regulatory protein
LRRSLGGPALAFYCVPITYRESVIGTLSVDRESALVSDPAADTAFLLDIALLIAPFVQRRRLEEHMEVYRQSKSGAGAFAKLIGSSPGVEAVRRMAIRVADASTTVLITGETGTGKGVVAQLIHDLSPRRELPFVEVNCGAIPENLVESELFGHEKGAFTGASAQRTGVLERSGSGTVFLDEIGELPLPAQTRLLRVLQTHEFERVGGSRTQRFQGRVVAATNRDLETALAEGTFRTDLYYRLNVFPIELPPLRERGKADVMLLADFFVQRFSREMGKEISRIDTPAIDMLTAYHWPGNVRELENVIERAVLLADTGVIHGHHLPPSLQLNRYADRQEDHSDFLTRVREYETELIVDALKDTNGNQSRAAAKLGITKRIMQYRIRKHGIDWRRFRGRGPV